ncbi:MAG: adenylyl-sulfate kinase [Deltaproteobacteria bacterium]|nr:adenylyl-sulfate kinase [Deltaproteobacteria bacterium]
MSGIVVWFTGLPSSGKSTLAASVAGELRRRDIPAVTLDSDDIRAMLPSLGYDDAGRTQLYALLARLAAHIARQGHVVLVPATAHRRAYRDAARALAPAFFDVFVDTPLDECRRRDTKGLYATSTPAAPGAGTEYEPPVAPAFRIRPGEADAAARIADRIAQSA